MKPHILILHNDAALGVTGNPFIAAAFHEISLAARDISQFLTAGGFKTTLCTAETLFTEGHQALPGFDIVFNLCRGFRGDDRKEGAVAGWMEMMGWHVTGNSTWTITVCQDRAFTRMILAKSGIPTPRFQVISPGAGRDGSNAAIGRINLVPKSGPGPAFVEEQIEGRELTVAILGGDIIAIEERGDSEPKISGSDDVARDTGWSAARLDRSSEEGVKEIALKAWQALRCRGYAIICLRLAADGTPYVLEVKPNPSLHHEARFIRASESCGITWHQIIERLVQLPSEDESLCRDRQPDRQ